MSRADPFLARWSRLKRTSPATGAAPATATEAAVPAVETTLVPDQASAANQDQATERPAAAVPAVALPDPASLTLDSDFTAFLKAEVGDAVRRQALKKLFNDPHFNVMDGLDIYIGDYSVSAPIPPELLAKLRSASEWLAGRAEVEAAPDVVAGQATERAVSATEAEALADAESPSASDLPTTGPDVAATSALAPADHDDPGHARN